MREFNESNNEILKTWDDNLPVSVISMGGLGPGYEQCIQIVALELLRRFKDDPFVLACQRIEGEIEKEKRDEFFDRMREATLEIDKAHDIQLSGAQAGAAQSEAWMWLRNGYAKAMNKAREQLKDDPDRFILVSREWPNASPVVTNANRI